jgi:hypothetical protein
MMMLWTVNPYGSNRLYYYADMAAFLPSEPSPEKDPALVPIIVVIIVLILRTRLLPSAVHKSPFPSKLMLFGPFTVANETSPLSPVEPATPVPPNVVMILDAEIVRIRHHSYPHKHCSLVKDANEARPKSPEYKLVPVPAIVAMVPVADILRIQRHINYPLYHHIYPATKIGIQAWHLHSMPWMYLLQLSW